MLRKLPVEPIEWAGGKKRKEADEPPAMSNVPVDSADRFKADAKPPLRRCEVFNEDEAAYFTKRSIGPCQDILRRLSIERREEKFFVPIDLDEMPDRSSTKRTLVIEKDEMFTHFLPRAFGV
jgi:hypothetical protein